MEVAASTQPPLATGADTLVLGVFAGEETVPEVPGADLGALLVRGEAGRESDRIALTHSGERRVLVLGLGPRAEWDGERAREAAALAHRRARELRARRLAWALPPGTGEETVAGLVEGTLLHAYRFDRFRRPRDPEVPEVEELVVCAEPDVAEAAARAATVTAAQNRARDLGNTPANVLTPTALAEHALGLDGRPGLRVSARHGEEIRDAGMGAFASVAQGSTEPARLIELRYSGTEDPDAPLLALVGKAVTYDSGGLSLKPPASMFDMKFDMCGGAAVIEAIAALAELRVPVRVLGLVGACENLPGPRAVKPGDIVTALDGTTIEVNNTDAEGRLVLADLLTIARRAGAARIVDIATLTGAVQSALSSVYAGLMSNDDRLAEAVRVAAEQTGELVWRLPLHPRYAKMTRGRYADLTNRPEPRQGLASSAAEFLHHFAGTVPWAHLDIAGVADGLPRPYLDKGASGFGVRLLVALVEATR